MKFRLARHTTDLQPIIKFYCGILDLELLGEFHDHDGYDGVFIGNRDVDWHLEFTVSNAHPKHTFDNDDLLIFYPQSEAEFDHLISKFRLNDIKEEEPKNPYWKTHGKTYTDPDGFRVVISNTQI